MKNDKLEKIKNAPNGFCLAKWYQVTIDLSRGFTHSCHHPERHKIPLEELAVDFSALHNTKHKKNQRKMMLEGKRPPECDYCWKIEDTPGEHISDRFIKSTDDWAFDFLDQTLNAPWDNNVSPTYLEVIFSSECNLNCAYCMADVSTSIEREMLKYGPYPVIFNPHRMPMIPEIKGHNPYVEAFWKWFPTISNSLHVFRITGGEPLLSKHTFSILDFLEKNPNPNLELALNTNLSYSLNQLQKLISQTKVLLAKKSIKKLTLYASLDTFGDQATYIRMGLDLNRFIENIEFLIESLPSTQIVIMCTFNILSISSFRNFLQWVNSIKKKNTNLILDISYLKEPIYLRANSANHTLVKKMNDDLIFMESLSSFSKYEQQKFSRIIHWVNSSRDDQIILQQSDFYSFINEFDKRFNKDFLTIFSEYKSFFQICKKANLWLKIHGKNE